MTYLSFFIGLLLPTLNGWLLLAVLQQRTRVLYKGEQWIMGCVLGLILTMLLTFIAHAFIGLPLSFTIFLSVQVSSIIVLGIATYYFGLLNIPSAILPPDPSLPRGIKIIIGILAAWVTTKTLLAGIVFLTLTPTYLDDTLDNWNLRGKVFFVDQALTLAMPNEDPLLSPLGVSSYSPAVPLMKTWLASINGEWTEGLVNSLHIIWYIAALILLYYALRRITAKTWALLGSYLLASMPLYLMHGTNPYADAFMSVHVFMAVIAVFFMFKETDPSARASFMRIGALTAGILPFTKNEGVLLYLPPLMLIVVLGLFLSKKNSHMTPKEIMHTAAWYVVLILLLTLPWLGFKWMNGLTFGNAKPVDSVGFGWQDGVALAWWINTFFEGNWLLLFPLLIALLIWRWRAAFSTYLIPVSFFLIVYIGQMIIFLFTGLSAEARMQTGLARGVVQLLPIITFIAGLLLWDSRGRIAQGWEGVKRMRGNE